MESFRDKQARRARTFDNQKRFLRAATSLGRSRMTLDVGCGNLQRGDVNIGLYRAQSVHARDELNCRLSLPKSE